MEIEILSIEDVCAYYKLDPKEIEWEWDAAINRHYAVVEGDRSSLDLRAEDNDGDINFDRIEVREFSE